MEPLNLVELAREVHTCTKIHEYDEKLEGLGRGVLRLDTFDLTRCPRVSLTQLFYRDLTVDKYRDDEVFLRSLFRHGILRLFREASRKRWDVEIEKPVSLELGLGSPASLDLSGILDVRLANRYPINNIILDDKIDIYLPQEGELLLVFYTKKKSNLPRLHHVERAIILQWLLLENGFRADRIRLLYYQSLEKLAGEYIVETKLPRSLSTRKRIRELIEERIQALLSPVKRGSYPLYPWECRICPLARGENKECPPTETSREKGNREPAGSLVKAAGAEWTPDLSLKATLIVYRAIIESNLDWARRSPKRRRDSVLDHVRASVTSIVKCPLRFWYSTIIPYTGITMSLKPFIMRGDIIHNGLQHVLEKISECPDIAAKYGIENLETEHPIETLHRVEDIVYHVKGRADIVVHRKTREGERLEVYELKTGDLNIISSISKGERTPHDHYIAQLMVYLEVLGEGLQYKAGKTGSPELIGILYYIGAGVNEEDRSMISSAPIPVKPGNEIVRSLLNEIHNAQKAPTGGEFKAPRYEWECRYCDFRDICPLARNYSWKKRGKPWESRHK